MLKKYNLENKPMSKESKSKCNNNAYCLINEQETLWYVRKKPQAHTSCDSINTKCTEKNVKIMSDKK